MSERVSKVAEQYSASVINELIALHKKNEALLHRKIELYKQWGDQHVQFPVSGSLVHIVFHEQTSPIADALAMAGFSHLLGQKKIWLRDLAQVYFLCRTLPDHAFPDGKPEALEVLCSLCAQACLFNSEHRPSFADLYEEQMP